MRKKSEDAKPVIDGYGDHALLAEGNAVEARNGTRAARETAAPSNISTARVSKALFDMFAVPLSLCSARAENLPKSA